MARNILDELEQVDTGDFYTDIIETCQTYQDYGQLLVELLEWFSGSGMWDDRTADFLEEMYSDYYASRYA